jgi:hypothetical protein
MGRTKEAAPMSSTPRARRRTPHDAAISIDYTAHGVTLAATIPGYAGHVIGRATIPDALRALADALAEADARRPAPVGIA